MKASSITAPVKAAAKEAPDLEEAIEEDDDGQVAEPVDAADEDEIDFKKDKYIKQPKKKPAAKKASTKADGDDDEDAAPKKGRGRPKAATTKAKGKK
jgi:replication factor C subunit 1